MKQEELIEQYVTGRLSSEDKVVFEDKMLSQPKLKNEIALQKQIIESIKKARIQNLKALLSSTPILPLSSSYLIVKKVLIAIFSFGVLSSMLYLYINRFNNEPQPVNLHLQDESMSSQLNGTIPLVFPNQEMQKDSSLTPSSEKDYLNHSLKINFLVHKIKEPIDGLLETEKKTRQTVVPAPSITLNIPNDSLLFHDSKNEIYDNLKTLQQQQRSDLKLSIQRTEVEIDETNKKYSFHYQFINKKFFLFGSFKESLYEIIEIKINDPEIFLYYKNEFYVLNKQQGIKVSPLIPIKNRELITHLTKLLHKKM